jgi:hypothetical protein
MLVSYLCHLYSKDAPDALVDERVEFEKVVLFHHPIFASPEKDVGDVLFEDLVFKFEFDELVLEEVA